MRIALKKDSWRFWFWKGDYIGKHEDDFIKIVHDHVCPCVACGGECKGIDTTVFCKEFFNTCFQFPIQFNNPDNDILEHIKKMIEYWKEVTPSTDAWHARQD